RYATAVSGFLACRLQSGSMARPYRVTCSDFRNFRSSAPTTVYSTIERTLRIAMPTQINEISYVVPAYWIMRPMPRTEPMYSPTMAPASARPIVTRSPEMIHGSVVGNTTFVNTCHRVAPSEASIRVRSRSTDFTPPYAFRACTTITNATAIATFEDIPSPRTSTTIGASASLGMASNAMTNGSATIAYRRDHQNDSPIATPPRVPRKKPSTVEEKV